MQAWRKVMAAYRRFYDSHHLQADCQEPGSAPEPYTLGNRVGLYRLPLPVVTGASAHEAAAAASHIRLSPSPWRILGGVLG